MRYMANKNPKRGPRPQFGPAATTPKQLAIRQAARTERQLTLAEWRQRAEQALARIAELEAELASWRSNATPG